jgi:hypothetical protein
VTASGRKGTVFEPASPKLPVYIDHNKLTQFWLIFSQCSELKLIQIIMHKVSILV